MLAFQKWAVGLGCLAALLAATAERGVYASQAEPAAPLDQAAQIRAWIEQLGDGQYPNRERAQEELRRAGTAAFDALVAAQDHADVEIAQRARYLVRSIVVAWTLDSDSQQVKSLLTKFGELGRNERKTRAQHLATLDPEVGIPPLCRIMRFESDRVLSKQAAILIMSFDVTSRDAATREKLAELIRSGVRGSTRPAVEWLETYTRELVEPGSTYTEWERITQTELAALAKSPQNSDKEIVRDLLRWQTQLLLLGGRTEDALVNFRRTYDLIADATRDIHEALDWALERGLLKAPDEIAARFPLKVHSEPELLYRLAEAQFKRGETETADKTAQAALQLKPGRLNDHMVIAAMLYQRGLIDWSVGEYEGILTTVKVDSEDGIDARITLTEMLHDVGRELQAAEAMKPLVDHIDGAGKESELAQLISTTCRGNMHYWYGLHYGQSDQRAKQIEQFDQAIAAHPTNIDILIAMYRIPQPDPEWHKGVVKKIDAHLGKCRTTITQYEEGLRRQPNMEAAISQRLATAYNELAWLISNTHGDPQEAVRASRRSLELDRDNAAYLDTLGRCYYAAGDFENAIASQRQALKAMPHLQVMQRQLKLFEEAQQKKSAGG